jgi:hypothetical protein
VIFEPKRLAEIAFLSGSAAALITNPAATKIFVHFIILHNTHDAAIVVELWNVPDDSGVGTAADANKFLKLSIDAGDTVFLPMSKPGIILEDEDDSLQGKAATASKVTIQIYGFQES